MESVGAKIDGRDLGIRDAMAGGIVVAIEAAFHGEAFRRRGRRDEVDDRFIIA